MKGTTVMVNKTPNAYPGKPCVYRAFDADGVLLYIGSTQDFRARLIAHLNGSIWVDLVAEWSITEFHFIFGARLAEKQAIAAEHPRWNVTDRSEDHPDGPLITRQIAARYPEGLRPLGWQFREPAA